jgi:hypothetical protein
VKVTAISGTGKRGGRQAEERNKADSSKYVFHSLSFQNLK